MNKDGVTVGFPVHRYLSPSTDAHRWAFTSGDHEGHRVQTSVHFNLLGFHVFLSLYGSFSCVLAKAYLCNVFTELQVFSHHLVVTMVMPGFRVFVKPVV